MLSLYNYIFISLYIFFSHINKKTNSGQSKIVENSTCKYLHIFDQGQIHPFFFKVIKFYINSV